MKKEKTGLSVNINKMATLRNARGKNTPDLIRLAKIVLQFEVKGLTVHPRPDERHIRYQDVFQIKKLLENYPHKEYNIEGYPSTDFLNLIEKIRPHQCTLVPDPPHVLTSQAGWDFVKQKALLKNVTQRLSSYGVRSSLFLDPLSMDGEQFSALKEIHPDRIELYTESYADQWNTPQRDSILSLYKKTVKEALQMNIKINAGHDLNQDNLSHLLKALPEIEEVSIGHALICEALEQGLSLVLQRYLTLIDQAHKASS